MYVSCVKVHNLLLIVVVCNKSNVWVTPILYSNFYKQSQIYLVLTARYTNNMDPIARSTNNMDPPTYL